MGNSYYRKSLKSFVLLLLVAVLAIPGMSAAATKEQDEVLAYLDQLDAASKYSSIAIDAYNANLNYNSKNRKAMHSLYVKTIIPNFTKYVSELKKIKPKNKELARLHKLFIQAMEMKLKGLNEVKSSISKSPASDKAFDKGQATIAKGDELQDRFTDELGRYYRGLELKELAKAPATKTLPLDFDADEVSNAMIPQMWKFYKAFASSYPSGNTDQTDKLLRAWIAPKNEDNTLLGPDFSVERLNASTVTTIADFDSAELKEWSTAMKATAMVDVNVTYSRLSLTDFEFTFTLEVEGYGEGSTPSFTVVFHSTGEQYEIKEIYHSY